MIILNKDYTPLTLFIELHMLKNYPFCNLNTGEFGSPKNCVFAGVPRGRIASQSGKRAWREKYRKYYGDDNLSIRTRKLPEIIADHLRENGKDEQYIESVVQAIKKLFKKEEQEEDNKQEEDKKQGANKKQKKDNDLQTKQIIAYTPEEIEIFKKECMDIPSEILQSKAKLESKIRNSLQGHGITTDIAAFGRMVTSSAMENVEAAAQVAHSISTNEWQPQTDFFTAVDDAVVDKGAAHLDIAEFDSCCYYDYICIDFNLLQENLGGDKEIAKEELIKLINSKIDSNPTGKNKSTASNILPSAMLIKITNRPFSLVNAYVEPCVKVNDSIEALIKENDTMQSMYQIDSKNFLMTAADVESETAEKVRTQSELIEKVVAQI